MLATSISTSILLSPAMITNATTIEKEEIETVRMINSDIDFTEVIRTIENKYFKQANDGTFYILDESYNEFDREIIDGLKAGMNGINDYIKNDNLKFEIINQNNEMNIVNTYERLDNVNTQSRAEVTLGRIISN